MFFWSKCLLPLYKRLMQHKVCFITNWYNRKLFNNLVDKVVVQRKCYFQFITSMIKPHRGYSYKWELEFTSYDTAYSSLDCILGSPMWILQNYAARFWCIQRYCRCYRARKVFGNWIAASPHCLLPPALLEQKARDLLPPENWFIDASSHCAILEMSTKTSFCCELAICIVMSVSI